MELQKKQSTFNTLIKRAHNKHKGLRWSVGDALNVLADKYESVGDIPDTNKYDSFNYTLSTGEVLVIYHHLSGGHIDLTEDSNPTQVILEASDYLKKEGFVSCSIIYVSEANFLAIDKLMTEKDYEKEVM